MTSFARQTGHRVAFAWGPDEAAVIVGSEPSLAVVVDVLSFSTTVTVAAESGITVYPSVRRGREAELFAESVGATLAPVRTPDTPSLSVASMRGAIAGRVVVASPNGATTSLRLAERGARVVVGCLRNAWAVGAVAASFLAGRDDSRVVVVACGERWPDGGLRPCVEDLWAAGAILRAIDSVDLSPEAATARTAAPVGDVTAALLDCASGRELVGAGFSTDVHIAAEVDACALVPELVDGAFVASPPMN
ncbi:2-phosphosulfolactate phosphatase [Cellulomonas sp.]|uniref:2-phosphosulfolactate phosphatase n=1 Tax=Cellulomonas sp. TaxID=40001 RepID=UPI003BA95D52